MPPFFFVIFNLPFPLQVLFKRSLSQKQWFSLLLLTMGCVVKQLGIPSKRGASLSGGFVNQFFSFSMLLLLVQVRAGKFVLRCC